MGLLLAPYNNAMRLGQGFNSFTHEICVDDAVVIDPNREENVLTNDGNSMRLTAMVTGRPSMWSKQEQVVLDPYRVDRAKEARLKRAAEGAGPATEPAPEAAAEPVGVPTDAADSVGAEPAASTLPAVDAASPEDPALQSSAAAGDGNGAEQSAAVTIPAEEAPTGNTLEGDASEPAVGQDPASAQPAEADGEAPAPSASATLEGEPNAPATDNDPKSVHAADAHDVEAAANASATPEAEVNQPANDQDSGAAQNQDIHPDEKASATLASDNAADSASSPSGTETGNAVEAAEGEGNQDKADSVADKAQGDQDKDDPVVGESLGQAATSADQPTTPAAGAALAESAVASDGADPESDKAAAQVDSKQSFDIGTEGEAAGESDGNKEQDSDVTSQPKEVSDNKEDPVQTKTASPSDNSTSPSSAEDATASTMKTTGPGDDSAGTSAPDADKKEESAVVGEGLSGPGAVDEGAGTKEGPNKGSEESVGQSPDVGQAAHETASQTTDPVAVPVVEKVGSEPLSKPADAQGKKQVAEAGEQPDNKDKAAVSQADQEAAEKERVAKEEAAKAAALKAEADRRAADIKKLESDDRIFKRSDDMRKAADRYKVNLSLEKMAEMHREFRKLKSSIKAPGTNAKTQVYNIRNNYGVSQTVYYKSFFVEKLSDITNDLGISAALSIKSGSCGGAGRGSFIDTDKLNSSDLNFYISVRVVNQSINFKDALEYNPIPGVGGQDFRTLFGDCFISGFQEGGELNALITMKILNTAKAREITADGAIALGKDTTGFTASGAFKTAKANLDLNSETTVQVSWVGGGVIKHPEEPWTVESLSRVASRFPDLVAQSPQRTHAILTRYETLRSYRMQQPRDVTPIEYENAKLYAGELMDIFMAFKAIYGRLTSQINEVQGGLLKFKREEADRERDEAVKSELERLLIANEVNDLKALRQKVKLEELSDLSKKAIVGVFPASIDGLDEARKATRTQMNHIIARVDEIDVDPAKVIDSPKEKFLPPFAFEALLPSVEPTVRSAKNATPLTGKRMFDTKEDKPTAIDAVAATRMCYFKITQAKKDGDTLQAEDPRAIRLSPSEILAVKDFLDLREEGVENDLRLTPPMGNEMIDSPGKMFTALDFVQPTTMIKSVKITVMDGVVRGIACRYLNGLSWKRGKTSADTPFVLNMSSTDPTERITSVGITVGTESVPNAPEFVLALRLVTNKGQSVLAQGDKIRRGGYGRRYINGRVFLNVRSVTWDSPLENGYLSGFWGWSTERGSSAGLTRLGAVWTRKDQHVEHAEDEKKKMARAKDEANEDELNDNEKLAREIKRLREEISEAKTTNENLVQDLTAKDATIKDKEATIKDREASIKDKETVIKDKDREIQSERDRLQAAQVAKTDSETQTKAKMLAMYKTLTSSAGWTYVQHKSGNMLHFLPDSKLPTIKAQVDAWNQKFHMASTSSKNGFALQCKDISNGQKWWLVAQNSQMKFLSDLCSTFDVEPVAGTEDYFYLKVDSFYIGTQNGAMAADSTVVYHTNTPGPGDQWMFVWHDTAGSLEDQKRLASGYKNDSESYKKQSEDAKKAADEAAARVKIQMTALHQMLRKTSQWVLLENRCGKVLDFHFGWGKAVIHETHRGWNQKMHFDTTSGYFGFELYCEEGSTKRWLTREGDNLIFHTNQYGRFQMEPVKNEDEWFFLKIDGQTVGPQGGGTSNATLVVIRPNPTDSDHWRFVVA